MFAKVIIDIPIAQVNRVFDYLVPQEWEEMVELGMRVEVPFGNRNLLGFIVGFSDVSNFEGELKSITKLLDYTSYLNNELIELSDYLSEQLQVFRIDILQTMLPNLLKVKYESLVLIHSLQQFNQMTHLELNEAMISKTELETLLSSKQIKQLIEQKIIELEYRVIDKKTTKKENWLVINQSKEELLQEKQLLKKNAVHQMKLIEFLLENYQQQSFTQKNLVEELKISHATIKVAENKGWICLEKKAVYRNPLANKSFQKTQSKVLRPQQFEAFKKIEEDIHNPKANIYLLEGITGSGKTEIYLQLMEQAQSKNKSALLLVPEISLTPQMVERVVGRFGKGVAVLHSGLSTTEKYDEWQRILKGEATIVVGARSSIFAPLNDLGIIIIDEEHETSYKQSDNPRYHAREVALWRGEYHQCPVVLGSATPSLESRARAQVGRYQLITILERANLAPLPQVELVDMTKVLVTQTYTEISPQLQQAMIEVINRGQQVVLLLNRRGYASYVQCRECGYVIQCPHCDISLTYHKQSNKLKCHYCDFQQEFVTSCPSCGSHHLRNQGSGTQKIEESLHELLPQVRILRMDNDTTRRKGDHERILNQFANREADILLGTQMIAKGLDFENVTLVGVINADTALNIPDFRASEKTFQLLTQVAGRTGRGALSGRVIIQTYNPEHYVMQLAIKHDYENFFLYEMKRRHIGNYPPYYFTTLITIASKNQGLAEQKSYELHNILSNSSLEANRQLLILGPARGGIAKINDVYYFQLLLKYKNKRDIRKQIIDIVNEAQKESKKGLYVNIDHEPYHFI